MRTIKKIGHNIDFSIKNELDSMVSKEPIIVGVLSMLLNIMTISFVVINL